MWPIEEQPILVEIALCILKLIFLYHDIYHCVPIAFVKDIVLIMNI